MGVAPGQDQSGRTALLRTDGTEDVGGCRALILQRSRMAAAPGPAAGDLVLLANTGLIAKPDLCVAAIDALRTRDLVQRRGEVLLKVSMAPSACA